MKLYHGSNVEVRQPQILPALRALDFGSGFYTTSSREQAIKWANSVYKRKKGGAAILNQYEFDEAAFEALRLLRFDGANGEWLDFVAQNRLRQYQGGSYDMVIGPVANDTTIRVVNFYMDGTFTKEYAIERLLTQKLKDQYAFLTENALQYLHFERSETL